MRITTVFTVATVAAGAALPAAAQSRQRQIEITRTPGVRIATAYGNENRAALGVGTTATGSSRDTLGLLVTSVTPNGPAEHAGLEEGDRIAAINGVSLRANAADVEDMEMSGALTHRLTRELGKARPGDEVELRVWRDGRTQAMKVKTADADSLFRRGEMFSTARSVRTLEDRPALGFGIASNGSRRDTLGVLVIAVPDSTPAAAAGLVEGNRIAAINGVNLRVAREDAGDAWAGNAKAQRLQREIAKLKPGSDVTLSVYSDGRFHDVHMKAARAADLPRRSGAMMILGDGWARMPAMPPMPAMAPMAPMAPMRGMPAEPPMPRMMEWPMSSMHVEIGPEIERTLHEAGLQLERVRPRIDRVLRDLPASLEAIRIPTVRIDVDGDTLRPVIAPTAVRARTTIL